MKYLGLREHHEGNLLLSSSEKYTQTQTERQRHTHTLKRKGKANVVRY